MSQLPPDLRGEGGGGRGHGRLPHLLIQLTAYVCLEHLDEKFIIAVTRRDEYSLPNPKLGQSAHYTMVNLSGWPGFFYYNTGLKARSKRAKWFREVYKSSAPLPIILMLRKTDCKIMR